ncbi:MAG: DUF1203 domain-containing protein [Acidobacteria bacterium]|nr:DUF1203 domain-containing protein [Acidobacteriota bacterium]MCB9399521.1 DUF1203 domain-containing protein [Acidobacteriota bacterium]
MKLAVRGIPTNEAQTLWQGGSDAYGLSPIQEVAKGQGNPCRHCLQLIPEGQPKWILAYRPFPEKQAYAETGPIFLHPTSCKRFEADHFPQWMEYLEPALVRGYDVNHWIRYETGQVIAGKDLGRVCLEILHDHNIAYVHVRSKFNCFQCRVERA